MKFIGIILLLVSCGSKNKGDASIIEPTVSPLLGPPAKLQKDCSSLSPGRLGPISSPVYSLEGIFESEFDFSFFQSNQDFKKLDDPSLVSGSTYGKRYVVYEDKGEAKKMGDSEDVEAKALGICEGISSFDEDTYEAAAVAVAKSLDQFRLYLQGLRKEQKLDEVRLSIFPVYAIKMKGPKGYYLFVDNAAYNPTTREIIIYPQGKNSTSPNGPFSGVALWQIPFIWAHEFSHHVFHHYFPGYAQLQSLYDRDWNPSLIDHPWWQKRKKEITKKNRERERNKGKNQNSLETLGHQQLEDDEVTDDEKIYRVLRALNEGIADYFAYLYDPEQSVSLTGINCLGKNRLVRESVGQSGQEKKWTESVDTNFFSEEEIESPANCNELGDQSYYLLGSFASHSFSEIFEQAGVSKAEQGRWLLDWIEHMASRHSTNLSKSKSDGREYLKLVLTDAWKLLLEKHDSIGQSTLCTHILEHFSGLYPDTCPLETNPTASNPPPQSIQGPRPASTKK